MTAAARRSEVRLIGGQWKRSKLPVADAPAWMARKMAEGYQLDAKLWAGLWLLDRNPDGSPA